MGLRQDRCAMWRALSAGALYAMLALAPAAQRAFAESAPAQPPALLLAEVFGERADPAEYWVSEKLDGVRALWDGHALRFRSGQAIRAPAWFVAALPSQALDGELWVGRRRFERLSGIVSKHVPVDDEWRQVRYMVFELPGVAGTFSERIARMEEIAAAANVPWLAAVAQFRVADREALRRHLDAVVRAGGEGLMLHRADAPWLTGRSDVLLKLTPWFDAEARVIGHVGGRGKYAGMLGALEVETPEGRRFRLGTGFTDAMRRDPPPLGATVTYRYRELNANGLPRFATYWRRRELP